MLTVHHLNNSRSQRVLWILEELGLDYDVRFYERRADMSAPDALKTVHPLGKSPILQDLDEFGHRIVLVESGAICEYLVEKAGGRLGATKPDEKLRYRQFLHYAEGSVMPVLFAMLVVSRVPLIGRFAAAKLRPMLDVHLAYIEAELSSRDWFAGEHFTAADVMMSFPLEAAAKRAGLGSSYPAIETWLRKIHGRPAYGRALERGGPYALAKAQ